MSGPGSEIGDSPLGPGPATPPRRRFPPALRRLAAVLGFFAVLHYVLLPQVAGAHRSLAVLSDLNPYLALAAVAAEAGSLAAYAQFARVLLPRVGRPSLVVILRLQLATLGLSHVVPGGTASAAPLGYRLLQRAGVAAPDAGFMLSAQSIASAATLDVLLLGALLVSIPTHDAGAGYLGVAIAGTLVTGLSGLTVFALSHGSARVERAVRWVARKLPLVDDEAAITFLDSFVERFRQLAGDRPQLARACAWAGLQWLADAVSLWLFLTALGVKVSPERLLIAFGLANVSASIPLTPGGIGVYEAVLTSSLVGFGVPSAEAIIGVLAYRLFEFWLPVPVGAAAYLSARAADRRPAGRHESGETIDGR